MTKFAIVVVRFVGDVVHGCFKTADNVGLVAGEWDPNTSLLAHRMKELQGRRAYLKNFWYAAGELMAQAWCGIQSFDCAVYSDLSALCQTYHAGSKPMFRGLFAMCCFVVPGPF